MPDLLTVKFQKHIARIGDRAAHLTEHHWASLDGHDEADIPTFAKKAAPTLTAAKTAAVASGVAYYAIRAGTRPRPVNARQVPISADPREPFIAFWRALKMTGDHDGALESGIARAGAMASNLTVSAARLAAPVLLARLEREPSHWVRTPDADACPWCLDVAEGTFATAEDADIGHDRCGCSIDPAF